MTAYKRAWNTLIAGIIGGPFAGVVAVIIGGFFTENMLILIAAAIVICVLVWLVTIFGEAIKFEISDSGEFAYFKRGKLKHRFDLKKCSVGYHRRSRGASDHTITLKILSFGEDGTSEETDIDASPLGQMRFERMFAQMETFAIKEEVRL
ncbi:MAG: hypothetical protein LBQ91_03205 [Oscillospiraceae bacterium]|jgi:hypothetical protein|nr:hypothetical protein [Oscillospiraceae bacterium]